MAPLESALDEAPARPRTIDSLMRALLYVSQQLGRPVSEAELRGLAVLPEGPLDSAAFLLAARRLGFDAQAVDLTRTSLHALPAPFVVLGDGGPADVVLSIDRDQATLLDVVAGRIVQAPRTQAYMHQMALTTRDLDPDGVTDFVRQELAYWTPLAKEVGLRIE